MGLAPVAPADPVDLVVLVCDRPYSCLNSLTQICEKHFCKTAFAIDIFTADDEFLFCAILPPRRL